MPGGAGSKGAAMRPAALFISRRIQFNPTFARVRACVRKMIERSSPTMQEGLSWTEGARGRPRKERGREAEKKRERVEASRSRGEGGTEPEARIVDPVRAQ